MWLKGLRILSCFLIWLSCESNAEQNITFIKHMNTKISNVGTGHIPTTEIENRATVTTYDTRLYINAGSHDNEFQQLRNHPTIRDFANVNPDIYDLVALTNPTLKIFFDLAKRICEVEDE